MFVNVPLAAVAVLLTVREVADDSRDARQRRTERRPDVVGAALITSGVSALVLAVVRTEQNGWTSPVTVITLTASVVLLAAFVGVEHATRCEPVLRLGLLATGNVAGANVFNLLLGAVLGSGFFFVVLYLQQVLGAGPAMTGLMSLPFAVGVVAGSVLAVKLGYRVSPRTLLVVGGLLGAAGYSGYALLSSDGSYTGDVLVPLMISSVGYGLCLAPVVSIGTSGVDVHETGTASALLNSSRQLGAALGLAALGTAAYRHAGDPRTPASLTDGYALGLTLDAGLLLVAVVIALTLLGHTRRAPEPL